MGRILAVLLSVAILSGAGVAAWLGWQHFETERKLAAQQELIESLEARLDRVWDSHLVADLKVDAVRRDPKTGASTMGLTFVQYAPGTQQAIFTRRFTLPGTEVYVDAWVVRFDRRFVEAGDGLKGHGLLLFRRAFSDQEKPADGTPLWRAPGDAVVPTVDHIDGGPEAFQTRIWQRFWRYANDPAAAKQAGIRVAEGEAPHVKVVPGQVYELTLSGAAGLTLHPRLPAAVLEASAPAPAAPPEGDAPR